MGNAVGNPADGDRLDAAMRAYHRGEAGAARAGAQAVLMAQPADADALNLLGVLALQAGTVETARRWLTHACHACPTALSARLNLATLHQDLGDLDRAAQGYRQGLAQAPDSVVALNNLGNVLTDLDRPAEALVLFDRALAHAQGAERAEVLYNRHAVLLDRDDPAAAEAALAEALRLAPSHLLARLQAAVLALARGAKGEAEAHGRHLAALGPEAVVAPLLDSLAWMRAPLASGARLLGTTAAGLAFALEQARCPGLVLEFGVRFGHSLRSIAARAGQPVHGFDTFTGLPGAWQGNAPGLYSTGGRLPAMPAGVTLHPGLFADTLPPFLAAHPDQPLRFANVDCDLYDSARDVLSLLAPRIGPGTVLAFDEFLMNPNWQQDEFRAYQEAVRRYGWQATVLGVSAFSKQAVLRIDGVSGT